MTSYVQKKSRVFKDAGEPAPALPKRSESRMKTYPSATDARAWTLEREERRQHILEVIKVRTGGLNLGRYIPLEVLIDTLLANKTAEIESLKKQIEELKKLLDGVENILTPEQRKKLDGLKKSMEDVSSKIESVSKPGSDIGESTTTASVKTDQPLTSERDGGRSSERDSAPSSARDPVMYSDEGPTDELKTDEGPTDEGPTDEVPTDEGPTDEGKTDEGKTDEGKTDEGKTDEGKTDEGKTGEGKAVKRTSRSEPKGDTDKVIPPCETEPGKRKGEDDHLSMTTLAKMEKDDIIQLVISKDAEIIALKNALAAMESDRDDQKGIALSAIEQLENLKKIIEERDLLKDQLKHSRDTIDALQGRQSARTSGSESDLQSSMAELSKTKCQIDALEKERDRLKARVNQLEAELVKFEKLPGELEEFQRKSQMLESMVCDRNSLKEKLNQMDEMSEEQAMKLDQMELDMDSKQEELQTTQRRMECMCREMEAVRAERDMLKKRSCQVDDRDQELERLKYRVKEAEVLRIERDRMKTRVDELSNIEHEYLDLLNKMKVYDSIKAERDLYKNKYEQFIGLESECEALRNQVEKAKSLDDERSALQMQVRDCECCIADQEVEINRLVTHIECLAKGRDEQQERMRAALVEMRAELERKECVIQASERQLARVQDCLKHTITDVSDETQHLKGQIGQLDLECQCTKRKLNEKKQECDVMQNVINEKDDMIRELTEDKKKNISLVDACNCKDVIIANLNKALESAQAEIAKLQCDANRTPSVTSDQHVNNMLEQSKAAVKKVAHELGKKLEQCKCGSEQQKQECQKMAKQVTRLQAELRNANKTIKQLSDGSPLRERMIAENKTLKRVSSEVQEVAKEQIQELVDQLRKCREKVAELKGEGDKKPSAVKKAPEESMEIIKQQQNEMVAQLRKEKRKSDVLESQNVDLQGKLAMLQNVKETTGKLTCDNERLKQELEGRDTLIHTLQTSTKEAEDEVHKLRRQVNEMKHVYEDDMEDVQEKAENMFREVKRLREELAQAEERHSQMTKRNSNRADALNKQMLRLQERVSEAEKKKEEMEDEIDNLKKQLDVVKSKVSVKATQSCAANKKRTCNASPATSSIDFTTTPEYAAWLSQLNEEKKNRRECEKKLRQLNDNLEYMKTCGVSDDDEVEDLKYKIGQLEKRNETLQKELESNRGEFAEKIASLKSDLLSMEECMMSRARRDTASSVGMEAENRRLQMEIEELKYRLDKSQMPSTETAALQQLLAENEKLRTQLGQCRGELDALRCKAVPLPQAASAKPEEHIKAKHVEEPGKVKPAEDLKPVAVTPAEDLKPVAVKPGEVKVAEVEPGEVEPVAGEPVAGEPVEGQPVEVVLSTEEMQPIASLPDGIKAKPEEDDEKEQLRQELENCRRMIAAFQKGDAEKGDDAKNTIDMLQQQLDDLKKQKFMEAGVDEDVLRELDDAKKHITSLQQELEDAKRLIDALQTELAQAKEIKPGGDTQIDDQLQNELVECRKRIEALQRELDACMKAAASTDQGELLKDLAEGNKQIESLAQELADAKHLIDQLQAELAESKQQKSQEVKMGEVKDEGKEELLRQLADAQKTIEVLQAELAAARKPAGDGAEPVDDLAQQLSDSLKQIQELERELSEARKQKGDGQVPDDLWKQLDDAKAQIKQLQKELADAKKEVEELQREQNNCNSKNEALAKELADAKKEIELLESSHGAVGNEVDDLLAKLRELKSENEKLKQQISGLESENSEWNEKYSKSQNEVNSLRDSLAQAGDAANALANLKSQVDKLTKELTDANDKIKKLDKELQDTKTEASDYSNQINALKNEKASLLDEIAKQKEEIKDLIVKGKTDISEQSAPALKKEQDDKEAMQKTIKDLEANLDKMSKQPPPAVVDVDAYERKLKELQDKLTACESKIADLEKQLKTEQDKAGAIQKLLDDEKAKAASANRRLDELNDQLQEEKKQNALLQKHIQEELDKYDELEKRVGAEIDKNAELQRNLKAETDRANAAQKVMDDFKKSMTTADQMKEFSDTYEKQINDLLNQVKQLQDRIKSMESENGNLKDQINKFDAQLAAKEKECEEKLMNSQGDVARKMKDLEDKLMSKDNDMAAAKKDFANKLDDKENELANQATKHEQKIKQLSEDHIDTQRLLEQRIKTSQASVRNIAKDSDAKDNLIRELQEKIKELQNELEKQKNECNDTIAALRDQCEQEKKALIKKYNAGISNLQTSHEDIVGEFGKQHEKEVEMLRDELKRSKEKIRTLQEDKKKPKDEKPPAKSVPTQSQEVVTKATGVAPKPTAPPPAEKKDAVCTCGRDPKFEGLLERVLKDGIESLEFEDLQYIHTKICDATAGLLNKKGSGPKVQPQETDRYMLMRRNANLEKSLTGKQQEAQSTVQKLEMEIGKERQRLDELRKCLEVEKQTNNDLIKRMKSQMKAMSNMQVERDLMKKKNSIHEEKIQKFISAIEQERSKVKQLEMELDNEKLNVRRLKEILDMERDAMLNKKRKDTEQLDNLRLELEKSLNSEMMLRMQLEQSYPPPPRSAKSRTSSKCICHKMEGKASTPHQNAPSFYTELTTDRKLHPRRLDQPHREYD